MSFSLRIIRKLFVGVLLTTLIACSSDGSTQLKGIGSLTVSVTSDTRLRLPSGQLSDRTCDVIPETEDISLTLTDAQASYRHTWESFDRFPQNDSYFTGQYSLTATSGNPVDEGFSTPAFAGETTVTVLEDTRADAVVTLSPASAFLTVSFSQSTIETFPGITASAHSATGGYIRIMPGEERMLCLNPSSVEILITIPQSDGADITFHALDIPRTLRATVYTVEIDTDPSGDNPVMTVSEEGQTNRFTISPSFLAATAPEVSFTESDLILPEGDMPANPLLAEITPGSSALSSVILTTRSASLISAGFPEAVDLLDIGTADIMDLSINRTTSAVTIDFTSLVSNLVYLSPADAVSTFWLVAKDQLGFVSEPVCLSVTTTPVEIEVLEATPAVMCVDRSTVTVRCGAPGFEKHVDIEVEEAPGRWKHTPFEITNISDGCYSLSFSVPQGSTPVNVRVLYCEEVRSSFTVERTMPRFTINVDTYARNALIAVEGCDPDLRAKITERLCIYVNGALTPVFRRYPEEGRVLVIDLKPETTYTFAATTMEGVDDPTLTPSVRAVTERTPQLPNADFEERRDGPTAKNMPSGGLYARTSVNIFNWQHHTDIKCEVPKGWANTNDKTFNLAGSRNINTWYLQPSVQTVRDDAKSGTFATLLTSVAFDPAGEQIPAYSQTGTPYLDYSPIVPEIRYRAAGKLFLGEYKYDRSSGTETYIEGQSWTSRPSSLSGSYKFLPASTGLTDRGLVKVEVLGKIDGEEVTIADASLTLPYASSFTSFNLPLTYLHFGVKATRIKVMFASSTHIGSIEEETATIVTVPDPLTASSTGSRLWIDDLRLAY